MSESGEFALGLDPATLQSAFIEKLRLQLMKFSAVATRNDHYPPTSTPTIPRRPPLRSSRDRGG